MTFVQKINERGSAQLIFVMIIASMLAMSVGILALRNYNYYRGDVTTYFDMETTSIRNLFGSHMDGAKTNSQAGFCATPDTRYTAASAINIFGKNGAKIIQVCTDVSLGGASATPCLRFGGLLARAFCCTAGTTGCSRNPIDPAKPDIQVQIVRKKYGPSTKDGDGAPEIDAQNNYIWTNIILNCNECHYTL